MQSRSIRSFAVLLLAAVTATAGAQQAAPNAHPAKQPSPYSRVDLYGGYAFLAPSGSVEGFNYQRITTGAVTSAAFYFKKKVGAQVEAGFHPYGYESLKNPYLVPGSDCAYTAQAGPIIRFPSTHLVPFVHVLGGAAKVGGPRFQPCTWGLGLTAGGGLDYILPFWRNHLAVRVFQLDYEYMHVDFGPTNPYGLAGGKANINALRASGGMVLRFGDLAPYPPVSFECKATPSEVFPGDPVNVTATLTNVLGNKKINYKWTSSNGPVSATSPEISVETKGLAAGTYSVTAHAYENGKNQEFTSCTASFYVKPIGPPTIFCSASPTTIAPGDSSTITSIATSPANRPLTYSYTASAGQISGTTNTAQLTSAGVPPGVITVICAVQDDIGQKATAPTNVTVGTPPIPPAPKPQALCSLAFYRDKKRPVRVDNEARACLDDIALTMQHQPDARLVVVGEHSADEPATTAAERAVNTKAYLTNEKGLDPGRIDVRTGNRVGKTAENYLLQPGATFEDVPTAPVSNTPVSKQAYSTAASYAAAEARKHHKATTPKPAATQPKSMEGQSTPKK
ncbi:MAG TPA: hypothetical protein VM554_13660 [Acidisarcina sp.]|nr:hypothetical protein [Acidisarcina sp.]